jgi:hypothetical protein
MSPGLLLSSSGWKVCAGAPVNGPSGVAQVQIQLDAYDDTYFGAKDLAASAEAILDGLRENVAYGTNSPQDTVMIEGISLDNEQDLLDQSEQPFLFRSRAVYLVTYQQ